LDLVARHGSIELKGHPIEGHGIRADIWCATIGENQRTLPCPAWRRGDWRSAKAERVFGSLNSDH